MFTFLGNVWSGFLHGITTAGRFVVSTGRGLMSLVGLGSTSAVATSQAAPLLVTATEGGQLAATALPMAAAGADGMTLTAVVADGMVTPVMMTVPANITPVVFWTWPMIGLVSVGGLVGLLLVAAIIRTGIAWYKLGRVADDASCAWKIAKSLVTFPLDVVKESWNLTVVSGKKSWVVLSWVGGLFKSTYDTVLGWMPNKPAALDQASVDAQVQADLKATDEMSRKMATAAAKVARMAGPTA